MVKINGKIHPLYYLERKEKANSFIIEDSVGPIKGFKQPFSKGRNFFLFFDFSNNTQKGLKRARESALYFIDKQLTPLDRVSIISYSQIRGLRVHEFLSSDREALKETVKNLGRKELAGRVEKIEDIALGSEERESKFNEKIIRIERLNTRTQILHFASVLRKIAKVLKYLEGNKYIVFFSTGVESSFLYGKWDLKYKYLEWGDSALREDFESMAKELASSSCIVYSVNTEGILNAQELSAGESNVGEHSLVRLSQLTGGKYYPNTEDLRPAMEDIAKRTSFYYVLGIPVKEEMDGKFHKIEVKVKRKGVKVHAPTGYYNPKPFKEYTDFEKFLHLVDSTLSEKPLLQEVKEFSVNLTPIDPEKRIYEVSFEISLKELLEGDEGIEVVIIFFDSKREIIKVKREKVEDISKAERFTYKRVIELPSNTEEVRIVVRNLSTGRSLRGIAKKG